MFVWLHYILWNPFLLLLLGRKWLNSNDYCVIITSVIVEYADGHCLLVLLRCKITFIFILFPFLVMLEPNGHCVNMTAFCIIALFSCFCPDFFFFILFLYLMKQWSLQWHCFAFFLLMWKPSCFAWLNKIKCLCLDFFFSINGFFYELSSSLVSGT